MTRLFVTVPQETRPHLSAISGSGRALGAWARKASESSASALQMDLGTLSPMLKRLEAKGLVTRRRQAEDERRVLVDLTPKGTIASQANRTDAGRILLLPEHASG